MFSLFNRLSNQRVRVIRKRQIDMLQILLDAEELELHLLWKRMKPAYANLGTSSRAFSRDLMSLVTLEAISMREVTEPVLHFVCRINLMWPTEITESEFFTRIKKMPQGKMYGFLT